MNSRAASIVLSLVVGSIGVAIGLYLGWFVAFGLQFVRVLTSSTNAQPSRETIALATDVTRWVFLGLLCGLGMALSAVHRQRIRFIALSVFGFAVGGALASLLVLSSLDRTALTAALGVPLGGAVAGLWLGLAARLGIRSVVMLAAGALAMTISGQFIDPRSTVVLPSPLRLTPADWLVLLLPGAVIGGALAALAPSQATAPPAA